MITYVYDEVAVRRIYVLHGDAAIRCVDATIAFNSVYLFAITDYVICNASHHISTYLVLVSCTDWYFCYYTIGLNLHEG